MGGIEVPQPTKAVQWQRTSSDRSLASNVSFKPGGHTKIMEPAAAVEEELLDNLTHVPAMDTSNSLRFDLRTIKNDKLELTIVPKLDLPTEPVHEKMNTPKFSPGKHTSAKKPAV